jgi:Ni/Co efflux regulator RcnB
VVKSNGDSKDKERKHKKHKDRDKKKDKDHKKHKHRHKDESDDKDKNRNKRHDSKQLDKVSISSLFLSYYECRGFKQSSYSFWMKHFFYLVIKYGIILRYDGL